ncbi:MAG: tyrosine-type recombinase/integrase [Elusimicrobia bacterium]|nr:tyrosine-type recombinase/integrase [Elusimicrobiota bacterium]
MGKVVDGYLALRRATGYQMRVQEYLLRSFVNFAAERGETHVRVPSAIEWARLAPSEGQRANRLGVLRAFARFARAEDPGHEVPPNRVFATSGDRHVPFIFSAEQVRELVKRARQMPPAGSLRPWTYATLFSLLAATGLRISEALNLRLDDVTTDGLVIRETKFRKSRLVPLHPTADAGLARYLDRRRSIGLDDYVFVSLRGTTLRYPGVVTTFLRLVRGMGIHPGPGCRGPRIHDLRHSFAVRVLEGCLTSRHAVDAQMLALSTYMGHGKLDSTYWYLHATPRLLKGVAEATEDFTQGAEPR